MPLLPASPSEFHHEFSIKTSMVERIRGKNITIYYIEPVLTQITHYADGRTDRQNFRRIYSVFRTDVTR